MNIIYKGYCRIYQKTLKLTAKLIPWREPILIKGAGCITMLPVKIKELGIKKVLIVSGSTTPKLHLLDSLFEALLQNNIEYTLYSGCIPDPTVEVVEEAAAAFIDNNCEAFIAFGGGSPIDCVKVAAARVARPNKPVRKLRGVLKVLAKTPTIFAVPTTAGTGSETTVGAVIKDAVTHEKYLITDPNIMPHYAVHDPELTVGLPKHITAQTGMDALTHAVEGYIGGSNSRKTKQLAVDATKLIFENLATACDNGLDINARENMQLASFYAGAAITKANIGYCHAIAHNIGGFYGVAHGLANAVILPHILEAYGNGCTKRLASLALKAGINGNNNKELAANLIASIRNLSIEIGIPTTLDCILDKDIPKMAKRAAAEANPFYPVPRILTATQLEKIFHIIA